MIERRWGGMTWWRWSLLAVVLWRLWGLLTKVALESWNWRQLFLLSGVVGLVYALGLATLVRPSFAVPLRSWTMAFLANTLGLGGTIAFYLALERGKAAIAIPFTAAYPIVTVLASVLLLREPLRLMDVVAILLFIAAGILVSL